MMDFEDTLVMSMFVTKDDLIEAQRDNIKKLKKALEWIVENGHTSHKENIIRVAEEALLINLSQGA